MIGYATIGVSDMDKAKAFYNALFSDMGVKLGMDMGRIAFYSAGRGKPMLAICVPYNEEAPNPGNGNMVAIQCESQEQIQALHSKALELGASCEGEPGQRIKDVFYGAYIRDPDGNKLAFFQFA